jgi:uroporphyrinogen decarboxylase
MPTGRERVEAALRLERADRPPVSAWGHNYDVEWDAAELARVTAERARRLGFDFVKLQIRATSFAEAFGADYRYAGDPSRAPVGEPPIRAPEEWSRLQLASGLEEQVESVRLLTRELEPDVPVIQTVFSPITAARFLGPDVLEHLRSHRAIVLAALGRTADALARFCRDSMEAGASGVFYAITGYASADVMTLREYEELLLPLDARVLAGCDGAWFNMLHLCGARQHFELAAALPVSCVNWQVQDPGNPALAEARDRYRKAVAGGLHRSSPIADGTPDQVFEQALEALRETRGRGHLLTPGCSVSPWPSDKDARFEALVRAASTPGYDA